MVRIKAPARKTMGRIPQNPQVSYRTFASRAAEIRYAQSICKRSFNSEKGFVLTSAPNLGYDESIASVITALNWRNFCSHPPAAVAPLVREFYAHLTHDEQPRVYTRGVQVQLDPETINRFYGLEVSVDLHSEFASAVDRAQLDSMLERLCVPGTKWSVSKQGALTVLRSSLAPHSRVWYHFLKTRLLPSKTMHTISKKRMLLLDSILAGRTINVGKIIDRELRACARKAKGSLWFPALISGLCKNSGAQVFPNEETLPPGGAITTLTIARLAQNQPDGADQAESPSGDDEEPEPAEQEPQPAEPAEARGDPGASSSRGHVPASMVHSLKILEQRMSLQEIQQFQTMELLQQMHKQQQQYWEYAQQRDLALKKSLQKNFTKPIFPFPEFPEGVLEPVVLSDAEESDTAAADED